MDVTVLVEIHLFARFPFLNTLWVHPTPLNFDGNYQK